MPRNYNKKSINPQTLKDRIDPQQYYESHLGAPKKTINNEVVWLCPFHNDVKTPNFRVNINGEKTGLYVCDACNAGGDIFTFHQTFKGLTFEDALQDLAENWAPELLQDLPPNSKTYKEKPPDQSWNYVDESGKLVHQSRRFYRKVDSGFKKSYAQSHVNNQGKLVDGLPSSIRRVLYSLPALIADQGSIVYITEGEKCADILIKNGFLATCCAGGSGGWQDYYKESLVGRKVVILEDNNEPGRKYGKAVAESLHGTTGKIKIVRFPDLPPGEDVHDFLQSNSIKDLDNKRNEAPEFTGSYSAYFGEEEPPEINSEPTSNAPSWPEPLAEEAYHGITGEIIRAIEPHTEGDNPALLIQFLTAFGSVVGKNSYFVAEADRHYMNLYCLLLGTTSKGRKGSSWSHISRLFSASDEDWAKNCVHSGLSSGEGLIWVIRDPIERQEPIKTKGRVTGYETVITDHGVEDKRGFILESEFAQALKVIGREGNTLSPVLRNGWDGRDLKILTKNNQGKATGPHISIVGHITKDEMLRILDSTEIVNGLINRFLFTCVKRSKCLPEGGKIHEVDFAPLIQRLREAIDFGSETREIKRDPEAREIWIDIYPELSEGRPGLVGAATARAEAQVMRIACIYASLDKSHLIKREHLLAALAVWDYCESSAAFVFGKTLGDPMADEIKRVLDNTQKGLTRTEISHHFKRNKTANQIGRCLNMLLERGLVRFAKEKTGHKPVERWFSVKWDTN